MNEKFVEAIKVRLASNQKRLEELQKAIQGEKNWFKNLLNGLEEHEKKLKKQIEKDEQLLSEFRGK